MSDIRGEPCNILHGPWRRSGERLTGQTTIRHRLVWLARWFRDFLYDLRFSARSLLRSPGFTAATLLSLALGIGATTAIYSPVDQVILHSLPVREPERLSASKSLASHEQSH